MTPDDHHLDDPPVARHEGGSQSGAAHLDRRRQEVANLLLRLNAIPVPRDLEEQAEQRLRERARQLAARQKAPQARHLRLPSWRAALVAACIAIALLITVTFVAHAAAESLPGDLLYGIKQWQQSLQLAQASNPGERANIQIQQLQAALADLRTEIIQHRSDEDIRLAVNVTAQSTRNAQAAVATIPAGQDHEIGAANLASALQYEHATLHALLTQSDLATRVALTTQLGVLGESIPTIRQITLTRTGDQVQITIQGKNFAPGAQIFVDGMLLLPLLPISSEQISILASDIPSGLLTIIVVEPGDTAATGQVANPDANHHPGTTPTDESGGKKTPGPGYHTKTPGPPTPTSGKGHGNEHGTPTPGTLP